MGALILFDWGVLIETGIWSPVLRHSVGLGSAEVRTDEEVSARPSSEWTLDQTLPSGYSKLVHWVVLEMVTLDLPDSLAALFLVVGIPWVQQKLDEHFQLTASQKSASDWTGSAQCPVNSLASVGGRQAVEKGEFQTLWRYHSCYKDLLV